MSGARPWLRSESIRSLSAASAIVTIPPSPVVDLLVRVEAEHRRVAAAADRHAVGVDRAERLARVLDDRQPEPLERTEVGGVAEDVHRQQRRRAVGDRRRGGVRVEVERDRVDVGEHGPGALVHGHVGAGHERERAGDHLVAVADADRPQRQVQSGGAARDGARVSRADPLGERLLELASSGPERQAPRAQHLEHALALRARR